MLNVSVKQAAALLGKCEMFVRIGLQRKLLPFGTAINISGGKRITYQIPLGALAEYMHIAPEVLEQKIREAGI